MQTWFYTSHNLCCWPNLLKSTQETSLITFTYILLTFFRRLKWCLCLFILPYVHCNAFSRPQIFACRMIPSTRNRGTGKICVMQLCDCNLQLSLLCKFTSHTQFFLAPMPGAGLDAPLENALVILFCEKYIGSTWLLFQWENAFWSLYFSTYVESKSLWISMYANILPKSTGAYFVISSSHAVA